jgi:spoIIIJ-associated protein
VKNSIEKTAETVEQATDDALIEMGVDIEDVEVEILSEKKQGFFGLGGKEATVRVSLKEENPVIVKIKNFINSVFREMEIEGDTDAYYADDRLEVKLTGPDMGLLIGRKGDTMDALQTIISAVASKITGERTYVNLDIEGYKERRRQKLEELASSIAKKVSVTGRTISLEPMKPSERRIVHMALQGSKEVTTASEGDEPERRVLIIPRGKFAENGNR